MSNSAFSTFGIQLFRAVLSALTVVLCSRWMGPEGRGELSIVLFWVNLYMIANDYVGGSSMANLMQKAGLNKLLPISFLWALFSSVSGMVIFYSLGGSLKMAVMTGLIAVPLALLSVQYNIYQGLAKVGQRNKIQLLLEVLKLLFVILAFVFMDNLEKRLSISSVVISMFWATAIVLFVSSFILRKIIIPGLKDFGRPPEMLFTSGFWSQNGHLVQFLNYRLSIWILTKILATSAPAGIYANALLIADTIWIFANSFGTIAHMRILQSKNEVFRADITLRYAAFAVTGTVLACLVMAMVPSGVYTAVFGAGFEQLKDTALLLIPAIIAVSASSLFSHYLHATDRFKQLLLANLAGLIVQTMAALWLIPRYGINGACIAADAGFVFILVVIIVIFRTGNPGVRFHGRFRLKAMIKIARNLVSK